MHPSSRWIGYTSRIRAGQRDRRPHARRFSRSSTRCSTWPPGSRLATTHPAPVPAPACPSPPPATSSPGSDARPAPPRPNSSPPSRSAPSLRRSRSGSCSCLTAAPVPSGQRSNRAVPHQPDNLTERRGPELEHGSGCGDRDHLATLPVDGRDVMADLAPVGIEGEVAEQRRGCPLRHVLAL